MATAPTPLTPYSLLFALNIGTLVSPTRDGNMSPMKTPRKRKRVPRKILVSPQNLNKSLVSRVHDGRAPMVKREKTVLPGARRGAWRNNVAASTSGAPPLTPKSLKSCVLYLLSPSCTVVRPHLTSTFTPASIWAITSLSAVGSGKLSTVRSQRSGKGLMGASAHTALRQSGSFSNSDRKSQASMTLRQRITKATSKENMLKPEDDNKPVAVNFYDVVVSSIRN